VATTKTPGNEEKSYDSIPFDIAGICTCRDVFALGNGERHPVKAYVRLSVPAFIKDDETVDESVRMSIEDVFASKNYFKRIKLDELNRSYRERMDASVSEWVLVDIRTLSYTYYEATHRDG